MIFMERAERMAYKVLTAADWAALHSDTFRGAPIDVADGAVRLPL
jgi:hypothetical protein